MTRRPSLLRTRPLALGAVAVLVAVAIAVTLAVVRPWAGTNDREDVAAPAPGDRLLQSVDVAMRSDGSLTRVGDTVVIARAQGKHSDTYSSTYDPAAVVDQLPVRVLTAYRTEEGAGTDLADLKGFSGRVRIDLTVQNLTVRPQPVAYDVAGRSRTTTALVGAPLTVVASAALPGVDPAKVVTAPADAPDDTTGTNGVLSQAQDGTTQVQWGSILAPPQLNSTATLRLVVDAKDFVVPVVDLSVQPGLVTDPSVGALIDSAFNPKNSSELALEERTIALVGDVNDVLGRASGTISSVRKTLDASSKTLGTKTVQSLTQDTTSISTSLKTSSSDIDALAGDLQGSLRTTQSATLQRMSETVSQLQDLIGDTSAAAPSVEPTGEGCRTTVMAGGGGRGVYGNVLRVLAQLDGYQRATGSCKAELQAAISRTIGQTDRAGNPVCTGDADTASVVCSLADVRKTFAEVTASIGQGQKASEGLDPTALTGPLEGITALSGQLDAVVRDTDLLLDSDQDTDDAVRLRDLADALASARTSIGLAQAALGRTGDGLADLTQALDQIHGDAVDHAGEVTAMVAQNTALATQLCELIGDGTTPGTLPAAQVETLRAYLVTTSCPDAAGDTTDLGPPPAPHGTAMSARLGDQATAWDQLATWSDTGSTDTGVGRLLSEQRARLDTLTTRLEEAQTQLGTASARLSDDRAVIEQVHATAVAAQAGLAALEKSVTTTQASYAAAKAQLDTALTEAAENSDQVATEGVDPAITRVVAQSKDSSDELGRAFDASADGLGSASDALRDGAATTLKERQADLEDQKRSDAAELTQSTRAGLAQVSSNVSSATRDLEATRTSLTTDLNNVLLDLGNPEVPGQGLLGTLAKSARSAGSADYQLGLASDKASAYATVRGREVEGILLRQAQAEASLQRQAELPAFATDIPATIQHRTIYVFHLGGDR